MFNFAERILRSPEVIIYGAHPVCCGNEPIHLQNALDFAEHAKTLVPRSSNSLSLFPLAVIVTVLLLSTHPRLCVEPSILNPKPFSERCGVFGFTTTCTVLTVALKGSWSMSQGLGFGTWGLQIRTVARSVLHQTSESSFVRVAAFPDLILTLITRR